MSITTNWDNTDQTIIRYIFSGDWNWDEFYQVVEQRFELSEHTSEHLDVIFDLTDSNYIPDGLLLHLKKFVKLLPENHGHYVIVGNHTGLVTIVDMFNRIFKHCNNCLTYSNSLEKARVYLAYLRAETVKLAA